MMQTTLVDVDHFTRLPTESLLHISKYLSQKNLANLSTTCRILRPLAQEVLFTHPRVKTGPQLQALVKALVRQPELASKVKSYDLALPVVFYKPDSYIEEDILKALSKLPFNTPEREHGLRVNNPNYLIGAAIALAGGLNNITMPGARYSRSSRHPRWFHRSSVEPMEPDDMFGSGANDSDITYFSKIKSWKSREIIPGFVFRLKTINEIAFCLCQENFLDDFGNIGNKTLLPDPKEQAPGFQTIQKLILTMDECALSDYVDSNLFEYLSAMFD